MDDVAAKPEGLDLNVSERVAAEALIVNLGSFEGPLDVLLSLSRTQKVDLRNISILALAEQYLAFIDAADALRLELAADYLVMAAWLAYLKSRLLLPPDPKGEGISGADMAEHLAFQLQRLDAMRESAAKLMARDQLGRDFFARGEIEAIARTKKIRWKASLIDLMQAYARVRTRDEFRPFVLDRASIMTMEQALERLRGLLGFSGDWEELGSYLPEGWGVDPKKRRSSTAATFAATLQLVKEGRAEVRQSDVFAPIEVRRKATTHG